MSIVKTLLSSACEPEGVFAYSGLLVRERDVGLVDMDQNIWAKIGCPMAWWIKARVAWPMR